MENVENGIIVYWDTEKNNIQEKRDNKGNVLYQEYKNGQKKFEKHADGSETKWYETGEILSQKDTKGNEVFYHKDGEKRLIVKADGTKNAVYNDKQFLLISGRHCDKYGEDGGLTAKGEKQAANIGKFIAYASQGKVAGLPNIVLPEVHSTSDNSRSEETARIILENVNNILHKDIKSEKVEGRINKEVCQHKANAELSIHSIEGGYDTADNRMGSIAFSVVGRDGFVVDRVVFNVEEIAKQIERIESKEKALEQQIANKINELKSKTQTGNISDNTHAKTQVLRELAKDNISSEKGVVNRKRSNADKQIIKSALDKVTKNTRS